jgi:hypothetical protein
MIFIRRTLEQRTLWSWFGCVRRLQSLINVFQVLQKQITRGWVQEILLHWFLKHLLPLPDFRQSKIEEQGSVWRAD